VAAWAGQFATNNLLQQSSHAQIYDAGVAEGGQPYFAMELIAGVPLDRYAHEQGLDARGRLELVARVCDAVQHAHGRGVIHRDLKPGNTLVDEAGQPKVLDFGVAHATDADLQTTAARTQAGQLLGTLSYMSPEQVMGDPDALDRRSDVYTLGVLLFQLLADQLPYHLDRLVRLWDAATGEELVGLPGHSSYGNAAGVCRVGVCLCSTAARCSRADRNATTGGNEPTSRRSVGGAAVAGHAETGRSGRGR
jgi:serine/threonine protein kinase